MAQIPATVSDVSDIRAYECLLPDDVSVSRLVARLVELTRMPVVGPDNFPLNYGLVVKGGALLDSECDLAELSLPHDLRLRLVPAGAAAETIDPLAGMPPELALPGPSPASTTAERCLSPPGSPSTAARGSIRACSTSTLTVGGKRSAR